MNVTLCPNDAVPKEANTVLDYSSIKLRVHWLAGILFARERTHHAYIPGSCEQYLAHTYVCIGHKNALNCL